MLTVQEVISRAKTTRPATRWGCTILSPPLKLRCIQGTELLTVGEILHALSVDVSGQYPNTIHFQEKGYWWDAHLFEIVE